MRYEYDVFILCTEEDDGRDLKRGERKKKLSLSEVRTERARD